MYPAMSSLAVSSVLLDDLLTVISARVREEIQAQVTTPYHPAATGTVPTMATAPQAMILCQAPEPGPSPLVGELLQVHQGTGMCCGR